MEWLPEEYTRHYIVQALFALMRACEYDKISISDIARKAGVGRATFYRYFKRKEDVLIYYFDRHTRDFAAALHFYPRCREDYIQIVRTALSFFKKEMEPFRLLRRARLDSIYLDYLNQNFVATFERENRGGHRYAPYLYAGMLFNVSMRWLEDDCAESIDDLAEVIVDAIYSPCR